MVVYDKITMEEKGQLIIFHITRLEAPRPSSVALTGEEEPGGMEALRTFVEEERTSLREGSTPEGWFFFKNSERIFRKVKVRCLQIIC